MASVQKPLYLDTPTANAVSLVPVHRLRLSIILLVLATVARVVIRRRHRNHSNRGPQIDDESSYRATSEGRSQRLNRFRYTDTPSVAGVYDLESPIPIRSPGRSPGIGFNFATASRWPIARRRKNGANCSSSIGGVLTLNRSRRAS